MIRDPLGIGRLLYGLETVADPLMPGTLMAAGAHWMTLIPDTHDECAIATFCKNPLHPGPCKGWKKHLGATAPGALNAIEKAHKEKVAAKRVARNEAKSKASKALTGRQLASPLHAKKATIKAANAILGDDEAKASKKADRVILNKTEIKKYSKIKAAQMNSVRSKNGLTEDPGLEDRLAEALAKDNLAGKDDNYQAEIKNSAFHVGAQLAERECKKGDGDCDGKPYEGLRDALANAATTALLGGDDEELDTTLADYKAGKLDFKPAEPAGPPGLDAFDKAADEDKAMDVLDGITKKQFDQWPESAQLDAEEIVVKNNTPQAQGLKKKLGFEGPAAPSPAPAPKAKKAKAAPAPLEGTAAQAEKGKDFGLGLIAYAKGNKTLGTKAGQKDFADKIQKALEGDDENGVIQAGADVIASSLLTHAQKSKNAFGPSVHLGKNEETKLKELLQPELEDGLKGGDAPKPVLDSVKKAVQAAKDGDADGVKAAKAELNDHIKVAAAKKVGADPNASASVVAAHILFAPDANLGDGKAKVRVQVLEEMSKEEFDSLPEGVRVTAAAWLDDRAAHFEELGGDNGNASMNEAINLQKKMGLPEHKPAVTPAGPDISAAELNAAEVETWFPPGQSTKPGPFDQDRLSALEAIDPDDFDSLPIATQNQVKAFLENVDPDGPHAGQAATLQSKFGFPVNAPSDVGDDDEPDVLQDLMDGIPLAGGDDDPFITAKEAFGPDGDVDHNEAVAVVKAMTPEEWKGLTAGEKASAMDNITDALGNGEPGASGAMAKIVHLMDADKPDPPTVPGTPSAPAVPAMSKDAKKAYDFATGAKSATAATKFKAYQQLEGEDFAALPTEAQGLILADLQAIKTKFLAPNKKIAVQEALDHLTPFAGGGSGAGGPVGATNPAIKSDADKIHDASDWASKFVPLLDTPGHPKSGTKDELYAATLAMLSGASANGTKKTVVDSMASIWAGEAVKRLEKMHEGAGYHPAVFGDTAGALQADIAKKFAGEPGPTPVLDAWTKAIKLGATDDADAFLTLAHPGGGADESDFNAPPSPAMVKAKQNGVKALWKQAGLGKKPVAATSDDNIDTGINDAMKAGTLDDWADSESSMMAAGVFGTLSKNAGVPPVPGDPADFTKIMVALEAEYSQAIKDGKSSLPSSSITEKIHSIGDEVAQAGDVLAEKNGWEYDSDAVKSFKTALVQSKLAELAATIGPKPFSPPTPSTPAAPKKKTNTAVGLGGNISGISEEKQAEMWSDLKALPSGKFLTDPKDDTYKNLLGLAAAHGTAEEPLSVLQVLKSLDAAGSKANGWTNINKWENEFVDWLKTPEGTKFAKANPTADPKLVKKITGEFGEYEGVTTDLAELSKKVKLLPGPGDFDESKPSSAFKYTNATTAHGWKKKMLADQGGTYTSDQLSGIKTYTGSSFVPINTWLRGDQTSLDPYLKTSITQAQSAMRPLPKDTLLIRGTGWDALPEGFQSAKGAQQLIGKTVMDEAFMSTSVGDTPGYGSGKPLWLEIEAPKGTQAAFVEGAGVSSNPGEREMLLAAGQQYRILGVEQKGGRTHVRVRIVTP